MVVRNLRRFAIPEMAHEYPSAAGCSRSSSALKCFTLPGCFTTSQGPRRRPLEAGNGGFPQVLQGARAVEGGHRPGGLAGGTTSHHVATAQKQDLSDPDVIGAFAAKVGDDRHLVALYLLTVADIRGTSPKVWNAWKGKLLEDLFRVTRGCSTRRAAAENTLQAHQERVLEKLRAYAIPRVRSAISGNSSTIPTFCATTSRTSSGTPGCSTFA